jgi:hypothetical protein
MQNILNCRRFVAKDKDNKEVFSRKAIKQLYLNLFFSESATE